MSNVSNAGQQQLTHLCYGGTIQKSQIKNMEGFSVDDLIDMIKHRQGEMSTNEFSRIIGLPRTTYVSYVTGKRQIGRKGLTLLIQYFKAINDKEMVNALIKYMGA